MYMYIHKYIMTLKFLVGVRGTIRISVTKMQNHRPNFITYEAVENKQSVSIKLCDLLVK